MSCCHLALMERLTLYQSRKGNLEGIAQYDRREDGAIQWIGSSTVRLYLSC
jgi:hypothetical protein